MWEIFKAVGRGLMDKLMQDIGPEVNSNFERSLAITLELEGGGKMSVNHADPGNWTSGKVAVGTFKGTKYGIAASAHPDLDIENLTYDQAKDIYKKEYWLTAKCNEYAWPLCACVFDFAVESGPSRARRYAKIYNQPEGYLQARDKFLTDWSKDHPGNRGVEDRCNLLAGKLGLKI